MANQVKKIDMERAQLNSALDAVKAEVSNLTATLVQTRRALAGSDDDGRELDQRVDEAINELAYKNTQLEAKIETQVQIAEGLSAETEALSVTILQLSAQLAELEAKLMREKFTVFRPIYRNIYQKFGRILRGILPGRSVAFLRDRLPHPEGVPYQLKYREPIDQHMSTAPLEIAEAGEKPDIFILSIIDWRFRTQRPQHIAAALSAQHRVFYVEMLGSPSKTECQTLSKNLYRVRLDASKTGHIQPYSGDPDSHIQQNWVESFLRFSEVVNATPTKHLVIQHPFWWQMARHLPLDFNIIFDCMDDIGGFSNTTKRLLLLEDALVKGCDRLIVSSRYLFDKLNANKKPIIVRNAGDVDHFVTGDEPRPPPKFLLESGFSKSDASIKVGYVGAIAEWFDSELLKSVAVEMPDVEFHLCGAITASGPAELRNLPNVYMYGEIPYAEAPAFIEQMDVMIIPFKLLPIINACDPVKFYEYSAMGKPTVSARLPELVRAKDLVYFASGAAEFAHQIRLAFENRNVAENISELRNYAVQNTWHQRGEAFEAALSDFPKVSVVVLSYGAAHWTLATLKSLLEGQSTYPNMEVLVVDNGSDKSTLQEIYEFIDGKENICLIENGENLGFAKGNNVGLRRASGEYVLLLNNDTFVAPGAVHAMMRHLQNTPKIGVVGPLTNNIGNEAKLDMHYADMDEMKKAARGATVGYRGKYTPVSVVAYFAAMFRRSDLEKFGLLNEEYGRGMFEDDDHCAVIKSHGYICALAEDAFVHHHLSGTFSEVDDAKRRELFEANRQIFEARWGKWKPHQYRTTRQPSSLNG